MPNYGDINYWENRYLEQKENHFDWLEDFDSLKEILEEIITGAWSGSVLMLGCGNSELSEKLTDQMRVKNISNIDLSANAIRFMKERNKSRPELNWEVMDARDLKFTGNSFDLVIDKCTLDTVMCAENSHLNCAMMLKEVQRVLKVGGVYLLISYGDPESRIPHLSREHLALDITVQTLKKSFSVNLRDEEDSLINLSNQVQVEKVHYVYICKKKPMADVTSQENFPAVYFELEKAEAIEEDEEFFSFDGN